MAKIRKIKEKELIGGTSNIEVYPITHARAVYDKNNTPLSDTLEFLNTEIVWSNSGTLSNMNDFVDVGVYDIKGEHTRINDNLPILNTGGGHSINARLEVLDSSIPDTTNNDDKCITQKLTLSNRVAGDGDVYIRTGRGRTYDDIVWDSWGKLQQNIEVGQVANLDNLIDNGIYSGVYKYGSGQYDYETFVLVVINDYAIAGGNKKISQFKYALSLTGEVSYKSRLYSIKTGEDFPRWDLTWLDINKSNIDKAIKNAIDNLVDDAPETFNTLKEIADWVNSHEDLYSTLEQLAKSNNDLIINEIERAVSAESSLNSDIRRVNDTAARVDGNAFSATANEVKLTTTGVNTAKQHNVVLPAATTDKAGVMSAADKEKLEGQLIRLAGFSPNDAVNIGDIVFNNNSTSSTYRQLRRYVGVINGVKTFEGVPFVDGAIYTYDNKLYIYNGTELIDVSSELRNAVPLLQSEIGASARYYATYDSDVAKVESYINPVGTVVGNANFGYTKPIKVLAGEVLSVQGLGNGIPYYLWVTESGNYISTGEISSSVLERKVMTLSQDGYIALNLRIKKAATVGAPQFEAIISGNVLLKDTLKNIKDDITDIQGKVNPFVPKEYLNSSVLSKEECYTAFYNAMMKKCADYGINDALIGGPAGYGLESWNGVETERGKSSVDIFGLIKILGLVYGDWRLVDMWGEYDNPTLSIPIMRGESVVNQEISSTLGRSQFSSILTDNYCVLAAKGGTHEGIAVNYSAACTCDALKGNVVIGYVNTKLGTDAETASRYRAFKCLMDIAVKKFEDRNSDVTSLENVLKGQMVQRAAAVIVPNTNPQLLHRLNFANSSYYKLYEYNPGMVDTMSTIKSLTTAVALDYINDLNTLVTIKGSDITDATGGTHPIFESGDKLTIKDLIYANSVRSSNQASYALARIVGQAILKNERL